MTASPSGRFGAFVVVAFLILVACTAAPDVGSGGSTTPQPTPTAGQPTPTAGQATPTAGQPTPPPATDPPPGALPTTGAEPTDSPAPTDQPDPPTELSMAGTWTGTIVSASGSQGIRFVLRDLGGVISGTALWESGKVDNGLRGAFDGDTLTLDDSLVSGINVYEGTVSEGVFAGTHTTVPRLAGQSPSTFEVTREE